uniref:Uncharacterized protein n=1 Tax=Pararge aegeria TaxID=116150 RepID=S4PMD0_9NEOP
MFVNGIAKSSLAINAIVIVGGNAPDSMRPPKSPAILVFGHNIFNPSLLILLATDCLAMVRPVYGILCS